MGDCFSLFDTVPERREIVRLDQPPDLRRVTKKSFVGIGVEHIPQFLTAARKLSQC